MKFLIFLVIGCWLPFEGYAYTIVVGSGYVGNWHPSEDDLIENKDGTYTYHAPNGGTYTGSIVGGELKCQKEIRPDGAVEEYFYDENWRHTGWIVTNTDGTVNKLEVYNSDWSSYIQAEYLADGTLSWANGLEGGSLGFDESDNQYYFNGQDITGESDHELDTGYLNGLEYHYDKNGNLSYITGYLTTYEVYENCMPAFDEEGNENGEECWEEEHENPQWEECYVSDLDSCIPEFREQMNNIESTLPELLERLGASRVLADDFGKYGSTAYNNASSNDDLSNDSSGESSENNHANDGELRQIRRIYTVEDATAAAKGNKNTFSIKYR